MYYVNRTCTEVFEKEENKPTSGTSQQRLSAHHQLSAYVLLGDPGAGKTKAFKKETERPGTIYVTARDLIALEDRPEWHDKTLFIDGLDEIRAGSQDARTPFDKIRACLDRLGRPPFRLSCREADWFGAADQSHLKSVSSDGEVKVLHLDPLTAADIVEILKHDQRVPSAEEFMQQAERKGLRELLANPQVLDMLVKAVANKWPTSLEQTFELACETIVREHNPEHIDGSRTRSVNVNQQLNAVGFLCALQLIAGNAGFALTSAEENCEFPELNNLDFENIALLSEVGRTKLFKSLDEERITPVHRRVAEFLAARYLAVRVDDGLPIGRVLALITGEDDVVVAELRGLSAWLAAICKSQRSAIIERDPLGVVLYGDVQDFTREEKRQVLDGLPREAARYPWFRSSQWAASPFGALATQDMEVEFCDVLAKSDRSETHQALAACVLDAMSHGTRFPSLDATLRGILRDATWRPGVRRQALEVLNRNNEDTPDTLKPLLDEINDGRVADSNDDLTGYLLASLYPLTVPATELLNYLHAPRQRNYLGEYDIFWSHHLLDQSSNTDISVLLDELAARLDILRPILDDHLFSDFATRLLARGLTTNGAAVDTTRLYKWLGVGLDKYGSPHVGAEEHIDSIRSWLEAHPEIQKGIVGIGLDRCIANENFKFCMHEERGRLFHANRPADFGLWCLERMQTTTNKQATRYLLQEAVDAICYQRGDAGLSLETIEDIAERESVYKEWLCDMLVCPVDALEGTFRRNQRLRNQKEHAEKQKWRHVIQPHQAELHEGRAPPDLLCNLAIVYFGSHIGSKGDTPMDRLSNFLDNDKNLMRAALAGLCRTLQRDDIPTVTETIELYQKGQMHPLSRPFLAGLEEITRMSPDSVNQLSDTQIKQAVAIYLIDDTRNEPAWYKVLLLSHPHLVAEVMTAYVTAAFRSDEQHVVGLYALAYFDEHRQVAKFGSLAMLKTFPVRSTNQQLLSLDLILRAAVCNADRQALLLLIEKKLKRRSMNIAQRVRWLAAGVIAAPDKYRQALADFTNAREKRVRQLARFLTSRHDQWLPFEELPVAVLDLLVRRVGQFFAPYELEERGTYPPEMNFSQLVYRLISQLGSRAESESTDVLATLFADSGLQRWHAALQRAQFEQRAVRREASFRHPDIRQVNATLNKRSPANAGDLAALTVELLRELARQIRNGNTDDYCQYWNEKEKQKSRQLSSPKHEDACRDALLSDLKRRLEPLGIEAQPEGHYADNKRADIRVAFGGRDGFEVPIEIKKNSHPKLWCAIHKQLIAQYTREPRARGFGIYLVFWFGSAVNQSCPSSLPPPSGTRPRTADELENRLRATLSGDEARKISVCVIDVAKPELYTGRSR